MNKGTFKSLIIDKNEGVNFIFNFFKEQSCTSGIFRLEIIMSNNYQCLKRSIEFSNLKISLLIALRHNEKIDNEPFLKRKIPKIPILVNSEMHFKFTI